MLFFFLPSHTVLFGKKSLEVAQNELVGNYAPHSLRQSIYKIYIRIFLHGIFVSSLQFINLTVLFIMDSQIFILYFGIQSNTNLLSLLHKLFQLWSLETLSLGSCAPLTYPPKMFLCCCFQHFLIFRQFKMPKVYLVYFLPSELESAISLRSPDYFYQRMVFKNKDLVAKHACYYWSITSFRSSQLTKKFMFNANLGIYSYL